MEFNLSKDVAFLVLERDDYQFREFCVNGEHEQIVKLLVKAGIWDEEFKKAVLEAARELKNPW
jgi:hypothetical protein